MEDVIQTQLVQTQMVLAHVNVTKDLLVQEKFAVVGYSTVLLIYPFRHISFISPSLALFFSLIVDIWLSSYIVHLPFGRFSFHFIIIISRKVAMGLTVKIFWSIHKIIAILYISTIFGVFSVQLYTNIKILT